MIDFIMERVAPGPSDRDRLFAAVARGEEDTAAELIRKEGPDCARKDVPLLIHAAMSGRENSFRLVVEAGATLCGRTKEGGSLLHAAAVGGNMQIVKWVMENTDLKVSERNRAGKNCYDVAKGFSLKQFLMRQVLKEESGSGETHLGASRDTQADQERLRKLGPPPTDSASSPVRQQYRRAGRGREIKEDGFITTVGNPALSAKYGNQSSFSPFVPGKSRAAAAPSPPRRSAQPAHKPRSAQRQGIKIFNPSLVKQ